MSLMINQNITALNAWRNLGKTDRNISGTMEKLSSGLRINKAADDPSGLVISEQMRAQVVGLKAAIKNSEKGISMIQTAEAALDKMHNLLDKMRGLALDSANNATADDNMLAANQAEIDNIIDTITRISDNTQYGIKKLLDGSNANGSTVTSAGGTGVVTTDIADVTGLDDGVYNLVITQNAAGTAAIDQGSSTNVAFGASNTEQQAADSLSEMVHSLDLTNVTAVGVTGSASGGNAAALDFVADGTYTGTADQTYTVRVKVGGGGTLDDGGTPPDLTFEYSTDGTSWTDIAGTGYTSGTDLAVADGVQFSLDTDAQVLADGDTWTIEATAASITASLDGGPVQKVYATDWADVQLTSGLADGGSAYFDLSTATNGTATIDATNTTYDATLTEAATGASGTPVTNFAARDGEQTFTVDASKSMTVNMANLSAEGTVEFTNTDDSLVFQVGANQGQTVKIAIQDVSADTLAVGVTQPNDSGFASLAEIEIDTSEKATDAIGLIDEAIDQISVIRGNLGAFQANTLEANLDSLRVAAENLQASESVIRDTDMAAEMANFTKYQIMMQAGTSMLAQANQIPQNLLQLLQ